MAWDWEKGCDVPDAYAHGGGIYTPPAWRPETLDIVMAWEKAEAQLKNTWSKSTTWAIKNNEAFKVWQRLEAVIVGWEKSSQIPEFRRKYMEWLAKEVGVEQEIGFVDDISMDHLPILERIVWEGFRKLAKTEHPDLGGTAERFIKLREAKAQLDHLLIEVKDML